MEIWGKNIPIEFDLNFIDAFLFHLQIELIQILGAYETELRV